MAKYPRHHQQNNPRPQQVVAQTQTTQTQWSGPLPPPEVLQKFDVVIRGGAERILRMAETEQQHRISQESIGLAATIRAHKWGQILGATVAGLAIVGAVVNTYLHGAWEVSVALVSVPVLGVAQALVGVFTKETKKEENSTP
jgi:uncharacterized membrane protein